MPIILLQTGKCVRTYLLHQAKLFTKGDYKDFWSTSSSSSPSSSSSDEEKDTREKETEEQASTVADKEDLEASTKETTQTDLKKEFVPKSEVPGLSSDVFNIPDHEVGPGASKTGVYKNAEYFCYHRMSFYSAEIELMPFRLPQPSALHSSEQENGD